MTPNCGRRIRSTVSCSTGGKLWRNTPTGPTRKNTATNAASRMSGASPLNQSGRLEPRSGTVDGAEMSVGVASGRIGRSSLDMGRLDQENAAPPQLGELALVGVEHERTGVFVGELQNGALTLAQ